MFVCPLWSGVVLLLSQCESKETFISHTDIYFFPNLEKLKLLGFSSEVSLKSLRELLQNNVENMPLLNGNVLFVMPLCGE